MNVDEMLARNWRMRFVALFDKELYVKRSGVERGNPGLRGGRTHTPGPYGKDGAVCWKVADRGSIREGEIVHKEATRWLATISMEKGVSSTELVVITSE